MKRLLLGLAVVTGLAVGVVPVADAAPAPGCSKRELKGAKGEGIGASDIVNGGGFLSEERVLNLSIDLASAACSGVSYSILVTDPSDGSTLFADTVGGVTGGTTVVLANSQAVGGTGSIDIVVTTSSAANPQIDRAPNTGVNTLAPGTSGGQGWN